MLPSQSLVTRCNSSTERSNLLQEPFRSMSTGRCAASTGSSSFHHNVQALYKISWPKLHNHQVSWAVWAAPVLPHSLTELSRALPWLWREKRLSKITALPGTAETLQTLCTPTLPCPQENELYPRAEPSVSVSQWETPERFPLFYARISALGVICTHPPGPL